MTGSARARSNWQKIPFQTRKTYTRKRPCARSFRSYRCALAAGHGSCVHRGAPINNARSEKGDTVSITTILLIILILVLVGALPSWPHSRSWGYAPSGVLGAIVLVLIVLLLLGRI